RPQQSSTHRPAILRTPEGSAVPAYLKTRLYYRYLRIAGFANSNLLGWWPRTAPCPAATSGTRCALRWDRLTHARTPTWAAPIAAALRAPATTGDANTRARRLWGP